MLNTITVSRIKVMLSALFITTAFSVFSQTQKNEIPVTNNSYNISDNLWSTYIDKTVVLLEKVDVPSFFNYVVMLSDGNMEDMKYFKTYVSLHLKKDFEELTNRVGKGEIVNEENAKLYFASLQPDYLKYFADFQKNREEIVKAQRKSDSINISSGSKALPDLNPSPQNCGFPCTNPGFEAGSAFWDYWAGDPSLAADPATLTSGFNPAAPVCGGFPPFVPGGPGHADQHVITTLGGFDALVGGTILPVVPPGGGNNALRIGDLVKWDGCSWGAARASVSFTVSASNSNFTYRYAVVLEEPSGHSTAERPYFRIKVRDAANNVLTCGDYEVVADPADPNFVFFTETSPGSAIYYRPWTSVFIPLQAYIGQCVTVEFTVSDCQPGGHLGYAYIDCSCAQLDVVASSPNICGGNDVTLTAPAGGASYSWTNGSGGTSGIVGSTTSQTAVVNLGGTYHVLITSVAGPTCTTDLAITVGTNPSNPIAIFTSDTVCHGTPMQFTDASTPFGSIDGWHWDFDNDGIFDDTIQNPLHAFTSGGTFPVTLKIDWGACSADTIINVFVSPPAVPILTPAGPFCSNAGPVNLVSNTPGGVWSGNGITDPILGTFTPSFSIIGNDTVTYTITGSCSAISSEVIVVNTIPLADAGTDVDICSGEAAFIGSASVSGNVYSWFPSTGLSSASISNPTITAVNNTSAPITTTYTLAVSKFNCSAVDQVVVTINPQSVLTTTNPAAVCSPATIDLTLPAVTVGSTGGGTYSYFTDAGATIPLSTPTAVGSSGTYYIVLSANGACADTASVVITVNPLPVSDAGADLTLCSGGSGNIGVSPTLFNTYSWSPALGITSSATISNPVISLTNPGPTPSITTSYTVTTTETATGCQSTDAVDVTVYAVTTVNAGSFQHVCSGANINLAGSVGGSATSGAWSGGNGTYSPDNLTLNAVYTPSVAEYAADSVVLTLTTNDPTGPCTFSSSNVTFYFYKIPTVNFTADLSVGCPIHCTDFTNSTTVGGGDNIQSLTWNFGDGSSGSTIDNPSHCFSETGYYDITLTAVSNHLCSSTLTQSHLIEVYTVPVAEFNPTPNPAGVLDPTITFNNQSSSDVNYWFWDFGDTSNTANTPSPTHLYPKIESSTYTVTLIVHNVQGCFDTIQHEIFIGPDFTFYIPNVFSPNGDKINDYFYGSGVGIIKYDLWIFDRWGNMIFHGKDLNDKWDGKSNGGSSESQIDTYVWKVTLTDVFNKEHNYVGIVTLLK